MGDTAERVILEAEDATSGAVGTANANLDRFEQKAVSAHTNVVRITDQTRSSVQRLISSLEKQSEVYGKSGVDKLIVQRDQLLQRYAKEPTAIDAVTKSYEKMIAVEQKLAQENALAKMAKENEEALKKQSESMRGFGERVTLFMENPVQGASGALSSMLSTLGPWGVAISVGAGVLTGFALAGYEATKSLAEWGLRIKDVELRTGLTVKEVGEFSFAAKAVGQDVSLVERMMRGLSQAESDTSKEGEKAKAALKNMGVELRDTRTGEMKPTAEALQDIAEGLAKIPAGAERDAAAIAIFKRAGIEAIPMMEELVENIKRFDELGGGANQADVDKWAKYNAKIAEADTLWERMMRKVKAGIAGTILIDIKATGATWILGMLNHDFRASEPSVQTHKEELAGPLIPGASYLSGLFGGNSIDVLGARRPLGKPGDGDFIPTGVTAEGLRAKDAYQASLGSTGRLKQAEAALAKMTKPEDLPNNERTQAGIDAYAAKEKEIEGLKTLIENAKHAGTALKELENKVKAFELSLNERELSPSEKVFAQANALGAKPGTALYGRVTNAANTAAGNLLDIEEAKTDDQWAKTQGALRFAHEKEADAVTKALEKELDDHAKRVVKDFEENVKKLQEAAREKDKLTIEGMNLDIRHQGRMSAISTKGEGPAAELEALTQELAVKKQIRDMEFAIKDAHAYLYKMDDERQKNELENLKDRYEMEEKIAEVQHKEFETLKSSAEKLVEVLFTKPKNFGKDLASTLHQAVLKPVIDSVSSGAAHLLQPLIYGANGSGGINGIFHPNQDPIKVSTEQNTSATLQNSMALMVLTAHLAAGMGTSAPSMPNGPAGMPSISIPAISAPGSSAPSFFGGGAASMMPGIILPDFGGSQGSIATPPFFGGGSSRAGGGSRGGFNLGGLFGGGGGGYASGSGSSTVIGSDGLPTTVLPGLTRSGGFGGALDRLKGTFSKGNWFNSDVASSAGGGFGGDLAGALSSKGGAQVELAAGMPLAMAGITGSRMGTWGGVGEATAGGALTGAGIGTMILPGIGTAIGAGIGAAAGFGISVAEMALGIISPAQKVHDDVKSIYGVDLPVNSGTVKQIVSLAQSQYGGNIAVAVRSPSVRQLIMLYSEATGQKTPLSASAPYSGSLVEQGGGLFQQATYQDGQAHTYASNIPTLGGLASSPYPTQGGPNTSAGAGATYFSLNIGSSDAAGFMTGQYVTPDFVSSQVTASQNASINRTQQAANSQLPGLTVV